MLCNDSIISVKGDDVIEYEEYFNISLSLPSSENPESVQYGALSHAMVAIQETVSNDCSKYHKTCYYIIIITVLAII